MHIHCILVIVLFQCYPIVISACFLAIPTFTLPHPTSQLQSLSAKCAKLAVKSIKRSENTLHRVVKITLLTIHLMHIVIICNLLLKVHNPTPLRVKLFVRFITVVICMLLELWNTVSILSNNFDNLYNSSCKLKGKR